MIAATPLVKRWLVLVMKADVVTHADLPFLPADPYTELPVF